MYSVTNTSYKKNMMSSRSQNIVRNISSGTINRLVILVFEFIIRTVMVRTLGTEYLGLGSLFTSILQMLNMTELGFGSAVVFSMYKPIAEGDKEQICALLNIYRRFYHIVGCLILGIGLALLPFLDKLIMGSYPREINLYVLYIVYLSNTVMGYFLFAYRESLFIAHQRDDIRSNIRTVAKFIMYSTQLLILVTVRDYYIYVILLPLCTIFINLLQYVVSRRFYPEYTCRGNLDKESLRDLSKRVMGLFSFQVGGAIYNNADTIVVSAFLGLVILAKYTNYYSIMFALNAVLVILSNAMTASIGNSVATESIEKNARQFNELSSLFSWIIGWCSICLMCLVQPFMAIWMGKENLLPIDNVFCFVLYFYFWNFNPAMSIYKNAAGIWWEDRFRPFVGIAVNVILNIWWVQVIGINGVVLSSVVNTALISIPWGSFFLFKLYLKIDLKKYLIKQSGLFLASLIIGGITYFVCSLISGDYTLQSLFVRVCLCLTIPNMLYYILFNLLGEWNNLRGYICVFLKYFVRSRS